jgi:hypothetical protein
MTCTAGSDPTATSQLEVVPPCRYQPVKAIVLSLKTWYPAPGGHMRHDACHGASRGRASPAWWVGDSKNGKGFGHEKRRTCASDRCHHWCHRLGDSITSSGVAKRLASPSHRRAKGWDDDRWNIRRHPRQWPRLLLPRTGRRLLWPLVLHGVSIRSVIARCPDSRMRVSLENQRTAQTVFKLFFANSNKVE